MIDYKAAGVNIDAGNEVVDRIKGFVKKTYHPAVLSDLGGFAALYDLKALYDEYAHPVLVQSIDGLGTKPVIAALMGRYDTLGYDLLAATANDIIVCGAKPLTLLDYIGSGTIRPDEVVSLVEGMSRACLEAGVALVGGETAEMPGVYAGHEYDVVGIITGVVDKSKIINGRNILPGDVVLGFASSGLHTNGYSLARKLCFEKAGFKVTDTLQSLHTTLGEALLKPHINYTLPILALLRAGCPIKGMAHITGGGLLENIPRVLPKDCAVAIETNTWPKLPLFDLLCELGELPEKESYRTFNMGVGYILIVPPDAVSAIMQLVKSQFSQFSLYPIGKVVKGTREVVLK